MKMYRVWGLLGTVAFFLSGCVALPDNEMQLTVESRPIGAILFDASGQKIGSAPQSIRFSIDALESPRYGEYVTPEITARWPSGTETKARVQYEGEPSQRVYFTIERDWKAPGLDIDLEYAQKRKELRQREELIRELRFHNMYRPWGPYPYW